VLGGGGVDEHRGAAGEQSAGGDGHGFVGWCEACFFFSEKSCDGKLMGRWCGGVWNGEIVGR